MLLSALKMANIPDDAFIFNVAGNLVIEDLQLANPPVRLSQKLKHRLALAKHYTGCVLNPLINKKNLFGTRSKVFPCGMRLSKGEIDATTQASDSEDEDNVENAQREYNGMDLVEMTEDEIRDFIPATETYNMFPGVSYVYEIGNRLLLPPQKRRTDDNIDSTLKAITEYNKENVAQIHDSKQYIIACHRVNKGLNARNL